MPEPRPVALVLPDPPLAWAGGTLRAWRRSDAAVLQRGWTDDDVVLFNPVPTDVTIEMAERWIDNEALRRDQRLSIDLVIESDAHGGAVGEIGLSGFSSRHRGALVGYWLLPEARGHGLATQALRSMAAWAGPALDLAIIVARCHESNPASQRVAARAGFRHEGDDELGHQLWRSRTRG